MRRCRFEAEEATRKLSEFLREFRRFRGNIFCDTKDLGNGRVCDGKLVPSGVGIVGFRLRMLLAVYNFTSPFSPFGYFL
jgi:hypothetical protein